MSNNSVKGVIESIKLGTTRASYNSYTKTLCKTKVVAEIYHGYKGRKFHLLFFRVYPYF